MRSGFCLRLAAPLLAAAALGIAVPAGAAGHDRVYADSYGNLVVMSPAGYKRIIVGEGKLAREMAAYLDAGQPAAAAPREAAAAGGDCYRPPVFVKGRSYMYGLSDGEMPELSPCR